MEISWGVIRIILEEQNIFYVQSQKRLVKEGNQYNNDANKKIVMTKKGNLNNQFSDCEINNIREMLKNNIDKPKE